MKKKTLKLEELKVQSFVTSLDQKSKKTMKGGFVTGGPYCALISLSVWLTDELDNIASRRHTKEDTGCNSLVGCDLTEGNECRTKNDCRSEDYSNPGAMCV